MVTSKAEDLILGLSDARWRDLTAAHPQANIFHAPAWTRLLAESYGYRPFVAAVQDDEGAIDAGLPIMEVSGMLGGRRWISLPFTDHCAPLSWHPEGLRRLSDRLVRLSQDRGAPHIELRYELPAGPSVQPYSRFVLHTIPLCLDCEAVYARFLPMCRRNIKTAEKKGVHIKKSNEHKDLETFYRLHLETRRRKGVPIQPWRFFRALGRDLLEKGLGFVLMATKDDVCLAAAVFLNWQGTLTYKYSASALEGLSLCPNNLLLWTAIRWGCENGYVLFDMGRTDLENTGLRTFKRAWGALETPLFYSSLSTAAARAPSRRLLPLMHAVIRKSPPWVCRAMGELFYKSFGA